MYLSIPNPPRLTVARLIELVVQSQERTALRIFFLKANMLRGRCSLPCKPGSGAGDGAFRDAGCNGNCNCELRTSQGDASRGNHVLVRESRRVLSVWCAGLISHTKLGRYGGGAAVGETPYLNSKSPERHLTFIQCQFCQRGPSFGARAIAGLCEAWCVFHHGERQ